MKKKKSEDKMHNASVNYFEEIKEIFSLTLSASKCFNRLLGSFDLQKLTSSKEEIEETVKKIHLRRCEVSLELYNDFITPIEREDIMRIIFAAERCAMSFLCAVSEMSIWKVTRSKGDAIEFSDLAFRCLSKLEKVSGSLDKFRKDQGIGNSLRSAADLAQGGYKLYAEAMSSLVKSTSNQGEILAWSRIYLLEFDACRECERLSETLEIAILKNI